MKSLKKQRAFQHFRVCLWKMILALLHHESLIQGAQIVQAVVALGWMALGCGVIRLWWRERSSLECGAYTLRGRRAFNY